MSYCINPRCPQPNDPANINNRLCRNCGSELLLQGRYQVMRLLSDTSGFGKVYEAYNGAIPKILKVLKQKHNDKPRIIEPVHCIIMEKIDGLNLKQWMKQQGNHPISEKQAFNWLKQLAEILHLVHQKNYFHRDIKPENIMIRSNGQLVLIDFGTARELTYTYLADVGGIGSVTKISSAGYTPPEQEKGHAVPQSDFYALGRTFVYLLTGKHATDQTIYDPLTDTCNWRQLAPDLSEQFANLIDKLMAPTATARHKNTQDILDEITNISQNLSAPKSVIFLNGSNTAQQFLTQLPQKERLSSEKVVKPKKKWLVGGAVALVLGLGGYGVWQYCQHYIHTDVSLVNTIDGHSSYVNYIVISPDGKTLVSGSADRKIKIWDLSSGREIRTLLENSLHINYFAISPDWQIIATGGSNNTIKIWNLATGREIRTLSGHSSSINYLAISPDGKKLVSASADSTIKIWDLATGKLLNTLVGHAGPVNSLAISFDGKELASASADSTIKVWDFSTGKEIRNLTGHTSSVKPLAISPDGKKLVSASADSTIKVWDLATGKLLNTLT